MTEKAGLHNRTKVKHKRLTIYNAGINYCISWLDDLHSGQAMATND